MSSWRAANATVCSPAMLENEAIGADKTLPALRAVVKAAA